MPGRGLDAVFYVEKPPTIDFRDGNFHVCFDIGREDKFEVVMPPKAFVRARLNGAEVLAHWRMEILPEGVTRIGKKRK